MFQILRYPRNRAKTIHFLSELAYFAWIFGTWWNALAVALRAAVQECPFHSHSNSEARDKYMRIMRDVKQIIKDGKLSELQQKQIECFFKPISS